MKISCTLLLFTIAMVFGEPPVPSAQYLPAAQGYSNRNAYSAPSSSYGAPSPSYGPPNQGAPQRPSNSYGPPSNNNGVTSAIVRPPSSSYGPPQNNKPTNAYLPPNGNNGNGNDGDDQSEPANYQFEYAVNDPESGNDFGHMESRQGDVAQGKYYVLLPDGRKQIVEYVADNNGYQPKISYEDTGKGSNGGSAGGYGRGPQNGGNGGYNYRK